tara:strand:+ start:159 stop:302 length:144 start_codon:yes stop_codon:yes gene_type:complete
MNGFWELVVAILTSVLGCAAGAYWFSRTYKGPWASPEGSDEDPGSKQ